MNHSNEGIWEPPLAGGKPRRLTHFTASLTECIPFLDLAIRWARAVLGNSSCLVARCLVIDSGRFLTARPSCTTLDSVIRTHFLRAANAQISLARDLLSSATRGEMGS